MKLKNTRNSLLFLLQQWLHWCVTMLGYKYIAYVVFCVSAWLFKFLPIKHAKRLAQLTACWATRQYTSHSSIWHRRKTKIIQ